MKITIETMIGESVSILSTPSADGAETITNINEKGKAESKAKAKAEKVEAPEATDTRKGAAPKKAEKPAKDNDNTELAELRALITKKAKDGHRSELTAIINEAGYDKVSKIKPEDIEAIRAKVEAVSDIKPTDPEDGEGA